MLDEAGSRGQLLVTVCLVHHILVFAVLLLILKGPLGPNCALPRVISVVVLIEEAERTLLSV